MKPPFGVRLWSLLAALILVAGGAVYTLVSAWQRVQGLEIRLNGSRLERFRLAGEVQRGLLDLNDSLLRYALLRTSDQWMRFDRASRDLDRWINDHDPGLNPRSLLASEEERRAFAALNRAYNDYLASARAVHANSLPALVAPNQLVQLNAFEAQARRMHGLVRRLADAHHRAEVRFFGNAKASLAHLGNVLMASILTLLALVAAMGWVIYRDTIAPLRTKLVHSQTLLETQDKLATLGTLAAGIAHEIRNPLTSLKARLYTLEKHLQIVPAAKKDTDIISAEISRLEHIVQDVLNFARPSDPKFETLAAHRLLGEVQGLMAPGREREDVQLRVEAGAELFVRADGAHLKQVLINLVSNAIEAIEGPGQVTLRTRAARATLGGRETDAVILEVSDTGKGIPPEVQKRLFDPFFSTKESGAGLGLSIAARIVERHGGRLQYQTWPGHGTTFGIVLPRQIGQTAQRASGDANRQP